MNLGPLIFRVAGWPIETINGINSAVLTQSIDSWIREESAIKDESLACADQLYTLVPIFTNRNTRAKLLALRRQLHKNSEPLTIPDDLVDLLPTQLLEQARRRQLHADWKALLATQYEAALVAERAELENIAADGRFRKALCLASPGTYSELVRHPGRLDWRLTRTLLQFVLRAVGRPTPNGLWAGVALEEPSGGQSSPVTRFAPRLRYFERAFMAAVPNGLFPAIYEDAWDALAKLLELLPPGDRRVWEPVIANLNSLCRNLDKCFQALSAEKFQLSLMQARIHINGLLSDYQQPTASQDECVLVADYIVPFKFRVPTDLSRKLAHAVKTAWHFDRLGTGELDAKAKRNALLNPLAPVFDEPDLTACWEAEIERALPAIRHTFPASPACGFMPPGSALLRLDVAGSTSIRVGCITSDTGLFYGRFHHLFRDTGNLEFLTWHRRALNRIEHGNPAIRFVDLALRNVSDPNAAARPAMTNHLLDPVSVINAGLFAGNDTLPHLRLDGGDCCIVPLVGSAVSLHTSDELTRRLSSASQLLGRPCLLRPLPQLPKERNDWKHLPRLQIEGQITIGAERWTMPPQVLAEITSLQNLERFIAWRSYVISHQLPDLLYTTSGLENTESLLPCTSVLAIEVLARNIAGKAVDLRVQEAYPDPRTAWLKDSGGNHYVSEIAVSWAGDDEFWSEYSKESGRSAQVAHAV